ncbi:hypothetical protein IQE94_16075 [Synechocystis sp. PCC 7339]|nr:MULTISPECIES: hypothetical protein [unclassified Synechocystis]QUS60001.1 hypothetical protein HTZ78_04475 [Synechocystis sp. PCC 7338]UAJ72549.1 hypothetical protein IQE94_16075 [Synechocystis sp. PCC 7339]
MGTGIGGGLQRQTGKNQGKQGLIPAIPSSFIIRGFGGGPLPPAIGDRR